MCLEDTTAISAVRIPIRARDGSVRAYILVDAADAKWASQYRWHLDGSGYAIAIIRMHRELLGLTIDDPEFGDHINRNPLDNRRANLRALNSSASMQNRSSQARATSKHRGVYWRADKQRWMAQVQINGKKHHLGPFRTEDAAAEAAQATRARLMPYATN